MKKIIVSLLIGCMIFAFISCGKEQIDTTTTESTTPTQTTATQQTTDTTTETSETMSAQTTTVHTWNYPAPIEPAKWDDTNDEYFVTDQGDNEFESFYQLHPDISLAEDRSRPPVPTPEEYEVDIPDCEPIILIFRVLAREVYPDSLVTFVGPNFPFVVPLTAYYIQIVDVYGNITYDTNRTYRIYSQTSTTIQRYGVPDLEIGGIYARVLCEVIDGERGFQALLDSGEFLGAFAVYHVEELNGKRYLYSPGKDLSSLECAIPITNPEENSIYKVGKHDKQITELERLGVPLPTYDYKCELDAVYMEYEKGLNAIRKGE